MSSTVEAAFADLNHRTFKGELPMQSEKDKKQKRKLIYLNDCPDWDHMPTLHRIIIPLLKTGSLLKGSRCGDYFIVVRETCAFDSITQIVTNAIATNPTYADIVTTEHNNFCNSIRDLQAYDTEMDLEKNSEQDRLLNVYDLSPANKGASYKLLLKSMLSNDIRTFKNTLDNRQQPNVLHVNYVYPNDSEETLLDIASKSGSTEFVKLLLHEGANPNRIPEMYNDAPIHFATEGGHVATLEVLLAEPTINPNLEAGRQTALHIAVKKNDLTCADRLLNAGASASIPNNTGLTALHLAAMKGQCNMVKLILGNSQQCPDIDTYKDYNDQTTREVIQ
ncbi:PREDICTED: delta-latroinsectotoxin-Lt1a-like [Vollenhovia emeryi]|uniref:delta-latroinsectotoxin-Lt1a-like n=1 Tax=Vollenhovia emeryi TaxID=411798 RepID=UPI0005F4B7AC|nr:PREDICTED: delta-latroinsectotoxin-Lt1a-like [Vollenhovia emeryi]